MNLPEFVSAVLLLLCMPGPTNTLLSLAAHSRGPLAAAPLLGAEILGYLSVIAPVAALAAPLLQAYPQAMPMLKVAAGFWVLYLAARLWLEARPGPISGRVTTRQVYVTTLLNPKAWIIALVIMPHGPLAAVLPYLALFAALTAFAGSGWLLLGGTLGRLKGAAGNGRAAQRVAAILLFGFSVALTGSGLGALT